MHWGVYGNDVRLRPWLLGFSRSAGVPSFLAARDSGDANAVFQDVPRVEFCSGWESLLVARQLEAIVVGGDDEESFAAIRQLAQGSVPLYVRPHPAQGLSLAYELTLLAAERDVPIRPLWSQRTDSLLMAVKSWLETTGSELLHAELARTLNVTDTDDSRVDECVAIQQLDDLELLRWFGARGTRVTALLTSRPEAKHRRLSVTLEANDTANGLWTMESRAGAPTQARLTLQTTAGVLTLEQSDAAEWSLSPTSTVTSLPDATGASTVWFDDGTTWDDAVEVFEWTDAVARSLQRRRAIELHTEPISERTIFKTQMAAMGCAVLMGTLLLSLVYLAVASIVPLPESVLRVARILVFAPLFLFLAAQLLYPLTRAPRGRSPIAHP